MRRRILSTLAAAGVVAGTTVLASTTLGVPVPVAASPTETATLVADANPPAPEPTPSPVPTTDIVPTPGVPDAPESAPILEPVPTPELSIPTPSTAPEIIDEADPRWDCRVMGNLQCGVELEGAVYVITFENGQPVSVRVR